MDCPKHQTKLSPGLPEDQAENDNKSQESESHDQANFRG